MSKTSHGDSGNVSRRLTLARLLASYDPDLEEYQEDIRDAAREAKRRGDIKAFVQLADEWKRIRWNPVQDHARFRAEKFAIKREKSRNRKLRKQGASKISRLQAKFNQLKGE